MIAESIKKKATEYFNTIPELKGEEPSALLIDFVIEKYKQQRNFPSHFTEMQIEKDMEDHLSTLAMPMIVGEIRRYMRDNNSIRVSRSLRDTAYKAIYARENYMKQYQKEPTVQEIAKEVGISKEDIVFAMDAIQTPVSLQEPVYNDGGDALYVMDQISDHKNKEDRWIENLSLEAAMNRLNERERYIIDLRFFEGKTQMEVSDEIGISQAQVSRLEKNALKIMKNYLKA